MKRSKQLLTITLVISMILSGCTNENSSKTAQGAGTGALIGAGLGLLVGGLRGRALEGAAIGAAVGGGQGAYEGWKQEQDDERTRQITEAIRESKTTATRQDATTRAREELTRFLGVWSMTGWVQEPGQNRMTVRAKVNGNVEMSYFVELAYIDVQVVGQNLLIWGTSTIGYDEKSGYNISTRLNTLPEAVRLSGKFDPAKRTFTFRDNQTQVTMRFDNPDRFTAETLINNKGKWQNIESYTFTRS